MKCLLDMVKAYQVGEEMVLDPRLVEAARKTLTAAEMDRSLKALTLALPSESLVGQELEVIDPDAVHEARTFARHILALELKQELKQVYEEVSKGSDQPYEFTQDEVGRRRLRNAVLGLMSAERAEGRDKDVVRDMCAAQFESANNMTESQAALACLTGLGGSQMEKALASFEARWKDDANVMDTWFSLQASSDLEDTLSRVIKLESHPCFSLKNPNKASSLINGFGSSVHFHSKDGSGYAWVGDKIRELDTFNPQKAAGLTRMFGRWRKYDKDRQKLMKKQLTLIRDRKGVSKEAFEIADRSLKN